MYTIGEFSRITSITVKALRLYHDKGLLKPSFVDKDTLYRYYSTRDMEVAAVISQLKEMNFSLAEIQNALLEITDEADMTQALSQKKDKVLKEIERLNGISSAIDVILIKEKEASKMTSYTNDVQQKEIQDIQIISHKWQGQYSETGKAMGKIYRAAGRHVAGPAFNLYSDGEFKEIAEVESCLPIKKNIKTKLSCQTLKGGKFYSLIHTGPYEDIGNSYAKLFDYIRNSGHDYAIPIREVYLKGPGIIFKGNPEKYITEIQVPIISL